MQQTQQHTNRHGGHERPEILTKTHQQVTSEVLGGTFKTGSSLKMWMFLLAILFGLGVVGLVMRLGDGFDDRGPWGYMMAGLSFIITTAMAAPIVSILPRMVKGHWGRPISRAAELWGVVGILCTLAFIPILMSLPPAEGRNTIWFKSAVREGWPILAPYGWQIISMIGFAVLALVLLWLAAIPDLATARDHAPAGMRKSWYGKLTLGWEGTNAHWRKLRATIGLAGGLYLISYIYIQFIISSDFAQSFIPGWKDSVFPGWQAISGFQGGLATMLLTAYALKRWGGYKEYIYLEQFWAMGRLLLPMSIMFFYFWASSFITFWYGRMPNEHAVLLAQQWGPYRTVFVIVLFTNWIIPLGFLISNKVRKSILGPTLLSIIVICGALLDKIRIYVPAFDVPKEELGHHLLEHIPAARLPDFADILMIVGLIAGAVLSYLIASRFFPIMNIWELKEGLVLQKIRPLLKTELKVVGKPD